ncbi:LysR family transcriptional regulator [Ideonella livida]|uniref:LysR family transcriptional regulator n=1 Tax=Ideonella livida TaxID=2707176 RepID=A0A7C9TNS0_9BURK|nr:LysR family transcriptional regulator [Ideonella livida]NDY93547.1 LysR family transcriptional regulator [Ideonella livida]
MKNITFRQLRVFVEVARHLSFVRAAEALHLTPPAVTMQVKELESALSLALFDRQGRKVSLTTAGEYYLVYAKRLLATLKDADDAMARLRKLETGLLSVGLVSTAKYFVPRLLARFRQEHPGVEVRLQVSANREQLVTLMTHGEVDLAIMGRPPRELDARAEPFAAHPHVFVAPPGHPLLRAGHAPAAALAQYPLLVRESASGTRALMDRFLAEHRVEPRIAMEMPSNETIKQAVMAGMGLSFLSLHTLGLELKAGEIELLAVEGTPVMRMWNVVHLSSRVLSPAAEAFRYFILEEGEAYLAAHDRPWLGAPPGT